MSGSPNPKPDPQPIVYEIRTRGHLGREWTDWFDGLSVTPTADGDTLLTGPVADQAALYGLLRRVRDMGLPLLSVNRVGPDQASAPRANAPEEE